MSYEQEIMKWDRLEAETTRNGRIIINDEFNSIKQKIDNVLDKLNEKSAKEYMFNVEKRMNVETIKAEDTEEFLEKAFPQTNGIIEMYWIDDKTKVKVILKDTSTREYEIYPV